MERKFRIVKVLDDTYLITQNTSPLMILNDKQLYYFIEMHGDEWDIDDVICGCEFICDQMDNGEIVKKPFKITNSYEIPEMLAGNGYNVDENCLIKRNEKRM